MKATRERKEAFIHTFGGAAVRRAVDAVIFELPSLTDEQLDKALAHLVSEYRVAQRINRKNRERAETQSLIAERAREKAEDAARAQKENG